MSVDELMGELFSRNNAQACGAMEALVGLCEHSNEVYQYFDKFAGMLDSPNSYVRNRGLALIAANAKWDADNKINAIIGEYLAHITDAKPITACQCIKALPIIAEHKPELREGMLFALKNANVSQYNDSMLPLVCDDIIDAIKSISVQM